MLSFFMSSVSLLFCLQSIRKWKPKTTDDWKLNATRNDTKKMTGVYSNWMPTVLTLSHHLAVDRLYTNKLYTGLSQPWECRDCRIKEKKQVKMKLKKEYETKNFFIPDLHCINRVNQGNYTWSCCLFVFNYHCNDI